MDLGGRVPELETHVPCCEGHFSFCAQCWVMCFRFSGFCHLPLLPPAPLEVTTAKTLDVNFNCHSPNILLPPGQHFCFIVSPRMVRPHEYPQRAPQVASHAVMTGQGAINTYITLVLKLLPLTFLKIMEDPEELLVM